MFELPLLNHLPNSFDRQFLPCLHILGNKLFAFERRETLGLKVLKALVGQFPEQLDFFH
jgi:hypothetical protein